MTSKLDYCNALLGGCPASSINKLQIVQNAAARVLTRSRKYDHITQILQCLHWLPIKFRISYKILLLAYKALNGLAPAYLTNLQSRYNPTRHPESQNSGLLVVPMIAKSTKGGRTFSYLAPKLWNSLPDNCYESGSHSLKLHITHSVMTGLRRVDSLAARCLLSRGRNKRAMVSRQKQEYQRQSRDVNNTRQGSRSQAQVQSSKVRQSRVKHRDGRKNNAQNVSQGKTRLCTVWVFVCCFYVSERMRCRCGEAIRVDEWMVTAVWLV